MIRPITISGIAIVALAIGLNFVLWEEEVKEGAPPPVAPQATPPRAAPRVAAPPATPSPDVTPEAAASRTTPSRAPAPRAVAPQAATPRATQSIGTAPRAAAPQAATPRATPSIGTAPRAAAPRVTPSIGIAPRAAAPRVTPSIGIAPRAAAPRVTPSIGIAPQAAAPQATPSIGITPRAVAPQAAAPQATPSIGITPRAVAPQAATPRATQSIGTAPRAAAPQAATPRATPSIGTAPRAAAPRVTPSIGIAPRAAAPRVTPSIGIAPRAAAPRVTPSIGIAPQAAAPQATPSIGITPRAVAPQAAAPQATPSIGTAPRAAAAQATPSTVTRPRAVAPRAVARRTATSRGTQTLGTGATRVERSRPDRADPGAMSLDSAPSFDVVRINPRGDTVMAGRAEPGRTVVILDEDKVIGEVIADQRGEWVYVPERPLEPGSRRLSLESRSAGQEPTQSESVVILVVPDRNKDIAGRPTRQSVQPLALKVPRRGSGASTVLQRPTPSSTTYALAVDAVDYDDMGRLSISGHGAPGRLVQLYLNNRFIGRTRGSERGAWTISPEKPVEPGIYTLRVDQVDDAGKVLVRVSIPFSRAAFLTGMDPESFVVVQPGNSLWRIARRTYGTGIAYSVIYAANRDQISSADLIYPGQIFSLPVTN